MSGFVNPILQGVHGTGVPQELDRNALLELLMACISDAQEEGNLTIWGTLDASGTELESLDLFDDDFEILGGESRWQNEDYALVFEEFGRYVVTSWLDDNLAVDVDFPLGSAFSDQEHRRALVASLELTHPTDDLLRNAREYCTAWLSR